MTPELREAVAEVHAVAESVGVPAVLVGALMMEFTPEFNPAEFPPYKRTNDADFAVRVSDWSSYDRLRDALIMKEYVRHPRIEHRLVKGSVLIDLLPYGEGIAKAGDVVWPESEFAMSVVGFEEACATASNEVRAGLPAVPVISLPAFVLLKIIAFLDRSTRHDPKHLNDAEHIRYWLENYDGAEAGIEFVLERGWTDIAAPYAGSALLGFEIAKIASPQSRALIQSFLRESASPESRFMHAAMRKGEFLDEAALHSGIEDRVARLESLSRGFGCRQ